MTIVLHNGTDSFRTSRAHWSRLLELGQRHGWQPFGTEPPQWNDPLMDAAYADLEGVYTSVNDADARALACALQRALSSLSVQGTRSPKAKVPIAAPRQAAQPSAGQQGHGNSQPAAESEFAVEDEAQTQAFVAFAEQGRFSVLSSTSP